MELKAVTGRETDRSGWNERSGWKYHCIKLVNVDGGGIKRIVAFRAKHYVLDELADGSSRGSTIDLELSECRTKKKKKKKRKEKRMKGRNDTLAAYLG